MVDALISHQRPRRRPPCGTDLFVGFLFPPHFQVTRKLCKELNERFLCPMESDALEITLTGSQVGGGS